MVDQEMALTFSVRNNPGRFALLLGSGVSTGAGIPTGWSVVTDIIEKIASAKDDTIDSDPVEWYKDTYDEELGYDSLLEKIAQSKEERRSLLEGYFEPTEEEHERGEKQPTEAHESIAWLVEQDYINVILTTNFDRLLERALSDRGINPVVISGDGSAKGSEPLAHQDAVILKVNGDYKETNIKNIASELDEYDPEVRKLIDQVFREYGLIICGWSGKWDTALRNSLMECEVHRYTTFWAHRSGLQDPAQTIVTHRNGVPIQIDGAGTFFSDLKERVQALEGAESGAPLTREIARERVKRYLTRDERKIELADLVINEAKEVRNQIADTDRFPVNANKHDVNLDERLDEYEALVGTLTEATMTCAYWGGETANSGVKPVIEAVQRVGSTDYPGTHTVDLEILRRYPATYMIYGVGIAAAISDNWNLIQQLWIDTNVRPFKARSTSSTKTDKQVLEALHPWYVSSEMGRNGGKALRNRLKQGLRDPVGELIPDSDQYKHIFEEFEVLTDLLLLELCESKGIVPDHLHTSYWNNQIHQVQERVEEEGGDWGPLQAGLFDSSLDRVKDLIDLLDERVV